MNLQVIVAELKKERDRIDGAIAVLDGISSGDGRKDEEKLRTGASLLLKLPERASPSPARFR